MFQGQINSVRLMIIRDSVSNPRFYDLMLAANIRSYERGVNYWRQRRLGLDNTNRESVFGKNVNKIENQTLQSEIICVLFVSCTYLVKDALCLKCGKKNMHSKVYLGILSGLEQDQISFE